MEQAKSIIMNYKAVADDKFGAGRMKFRLTRLRERTGLSEQALIFKLLNIGWDSCNEFESERRTIDALWQEKSENSKN